jgi:hypothetical protein
MPSYVLSRYRSYRTWQCHHNTVALPVLLLGARGTYPRSRSYANLTFQGLSCCSVQHCLNLALQWGGIVYPWSDARVFGCLIGFGLLLITFLCLQYLGKEKLVPSLAILVSIYVERTCPARLLTSIQARISLFTSFEIVPYRHHAAS